MMGLDRVIVRKSPFDCAQGDVGMVGSKPDLGSMGAKHKNSFSC